jgi:hypothetical protein
VAIRWTTSPLTKNTVVVPVVVAGINTVGAYKLLVRLTKTGVMVTAPGVIVTAYRTGERLTNEDTIVYFGIV